jgi:hypothetical protein
MALKLHRREKGRVRVTTTECAICGYRFSPNEERAVHFAKHEPEDLGLSPEGERHA